MWGKKFGYVVGHGIAFPFKKMSKVFGLYFFTSILVGGLFAVVFTIGGGVEYILQNPGHNIIFSGSQHVFETLRNMAFTMHIGVGFLFFIALVISYIAYLPFAAGVIRAAITDKHTDPNIVKAVFTTARPWSILWAYIKISVAALLIVIIGGFLLGGIVSIPFYSAFGSDAGSFVIEIFTVVSSIIAAIVVVRFYFAPVLAALDKGSSLGASWSLSRNNWWLIFFSLLVIGIIVSVAQWLAVLIGGFILGGMMTFLGAIMIPVTVFLYFMLITYLMMPHLAALGYLYLVVTGEAKLPEEKIDTKIKVHSS